MYPNINFLPYFYMSIVTSNMSIVTSNMSIVTSNMSIVTSNIQKEFSILTAFKNKNHVAEATRKNYL
jgi:hypothetical protein